MSQNWDRLREHLQQLADLVCRCGLELSEEAALKKVLKGKGMTDLDINALFDWLESVERHAGARDVLSMFAQHSEAARVSDPLERIFVSHDTWNRLYEGYAKGILSLHTFEKIVASMQVLDTRDWDDAEISGFIAEIVEKHHGAENLEALQNILARPSSGLLC